jgi:fatty acid desaturase
LKAQVLPAVVLCAAAGLLLALLPASLIADRRVLLALRVIGSWLIAVAMLGVLLQLLPVTPGYLPDHME